MDRWGDEQRRRCLALVANHARFLLLPEGPGPKHGSAALSRVLARLSAEGQVRDAHPLLVGETFVDPERFHLTVCHAGGAIERGQTTGYGRKARDDDEALDRPKRLLARERVGHARRTPQAEHLQPALAPVAAKEAPGPHV